MRALLFACSHLASRPKPIIDETAAPSKPEGKSLSAIVATEYGERYCGRFDGDPSSEKSRRAFYDQAFNDRFTQLATLVNISKYDR